MKKTKNKLKKDIPPRYYQDICLECEAYCCAGDIYDVVLLSYDFEDESDYLKHFKEELWATVKTDSELLEPGIYMSLPCSKLDKNCMCSIYNERPPTCKTNNCLLKARYNCGKKSYDEAIEILNKMKATKKGSEEREKIIIKEFKSKEYLNEIWRRLALRKMLPENLVK